MPVIKPIGRPTGVELTRAPQCPDGMAQHIATKHNLDCAPNAR